MSEHKHTPGPWEYSAAGAQVFANNGQTHVADVRGYGALQYEGEDVAVARMDADGKLLAASPEMLSLLQEMSDYLRPNKLNSIGSGSIFHRQMDELIAKAKGST